MKSSAPGWKTGKCTAEPAHTYFVSWFPPWSPGSMLGNRPRRGRDAHRAEVGPDVELDPAKPADPPVLRREEMQRQALPLQDPEVGDDPLDAGPDELDVLDVHRDGVARLGARRRRAGRSADRRASKSRPSSVSPGSSFWSPNALVVSTRIRLARTDRRAGRVLGGVGEDPVLPEDPARRVVGALGDGHNSDVVVTLCGASVERLSLDHASVPRDHELGGDLGACAGRRPGHKPRTRSRPP